MKEEFLNKIKTDQNQGYPLVREESTFHVNQFPVKRWKCQHLVKINNLKKLQKPKQTETTFQEK